ncbi:cyclopropane-fatty-acyl-phospholipid synthase family protein [Thiohalobacter sp. IOR34]|uniref:SAM-dependent methyltransferase n=1 Tax=Thiohalobacter sp. IOR34 TaxID=3057176 RepID=UPI0025AFE3B7|nr:cyclopropane-fatty-acyl-phospholipid synthase family protein [Thiohalobacter sp. IOR34]WJW74270.1 cyclopropane-fatty-acyl-phospholipid synthase family protein [Thiohalobacter sp. IOR34]
MTQVRKRQTWQNTAPQQKRPAGAERTGHLGREIVGTLLADYPGPVAVRLWDGSLVSGGGGCDCTLVFNRPQPLRELIIHRDLVRLGEAYLAGEVDVEGNMESLFGLAPYLERLQLDLETRISLWHKAWQLPARRERSARRRRRALRRARQNSRDSIAHHYDVGNDFYRLWLDPEMVYSCAYFRHPEQSLAEAQRDKLDYICRKLRLQPGQKLLDIGCGWGALLLRAARHYGVQAHGITLSEQQYQHARERIRAEGLEGRVQVELLDYRELPQEARYDRVVSVGMFEHVGVSNLPEYFSTVYRVLRPGGLFLNHGITNDSGWLDTPLTRFVNQYVFPDGELTRISHVCTAMEEAGFELLDVESLRRHYALTLRHWVRALSERREAAVRACGERIYRIWRLYMAGSAYYFEEGSINVYQVLAGQHCQPLATPLRRDDLVLSDPLS